MRQLGQLHRSYGEFEKLNTEIVAVFREEKDGVEGLRKSRASSKAEFPFGLDTDAEATAAYSHDGFNTYIVDTQGTLRATLKGTKMVRPSAEEILKKLSKTLNSEAAVPDAD